MQSELEQFKKILERPFKMTGDVHCEILQCFEPTEAIVCWTDHYFDHIHLCNEHYKEYLRYVAYGFPERIG